MINDNEHLAIVAAEKYLSIVKGADLDTWMDIWTEDAIVEFPYASGNQPKRLEGKSAIYNYYKAVPAMELLREEEPVIYPSSDPLISIIEISMDFHIPSIGKDYNQDYVCIVRVLNDGKIISYREYWNPIRGIEAFNQTKTS
jgi:ketosteroid isomerase-like protein